MNVQSSAGVASGKAADLVSPGQSVQGDLSVKISIRRRC
jgi:hypothetical protein